MNLILELVQMPAVSRLGEVLLHFLWQGAVVAALLAVALVILRNASPSFRYWTACAAFLALTALPPITWVWLDAAGPYPTAVATRSSPVSEMSRPVFSVSARSFAARWVQPALPWLTVGWLAGVGVFGARLLGGWGQAQRLAQGTTRTVASPWPETVRELAARFGLHRPVALWESIQVQTPMVLGWLKPVILLPVGLVAGLSPEQVRALLAHELAHLRRHDYLVNLGQCVVESFLFYHPAVWWISRRIRIERELCCDELAAAVLNDRRVLAEALVTLAERESVNLALALGATGGTLTERVQRLLQEPPLNPAPSRLGYVLALLLAFGLGVGGLWLGQRSLSRSKPLPETTQPTAGLDRLRERLNQLDKQVEDRQQVVDRFRTELKIPDAIAEGSTPFAPNPRIERVGAAVNELEVRTSQSPAEIERLRAMSGQDLRHALNVSHPTPLLGTLLADLAIAEQQRATLAERYLPRHPMFERTTEIIAKINSQIDDVVQGIMGSLEAQLITDEATLAQLRKSLEELQVEQASAIARYRPYFREKRDLDTLQRMREALLLQVTQERINAAVSAPAGR